MNYKQKVLDYIKDNPAYIGVPQDPYTYFGWVIICVGVSRDLYTSLDRVITYAKSKNHDDNCDKNICNSDKGGDEE